MKSVFIHRILCQSSVSKHKKKFLVERYIINVAYSKKADQALKKNGLVDTKSCTREDLKQSYNLQSEKKVCCSHSDMVNINCLSDCLV